MITPKDPVKSTHILPKLKQYFNTKNGTRISDVIPASPPSPSSADDDPGADK